MIELQSCYKPKIPDIFGNWVPAWFARVYHLILWRSSFAGTVSVKWIWVLCRVVGYIYSLFCFQFSLRRFQGQVKGFWVSWPSPHSWPISPFILCYRRIDLGLGSVFYLIFIFVCWVSCSCTSTVRSILFSKIVMVCRNVSFRHTDCQCNQSTFMGKIDIL